MAEITARQLAEALRRAAGDFTDGYSFQKAAFYVLNNLLEPAKDQLLEDLAEIESAEPIRFGGRATDWRGAFERVKKAALASRAAPVRQTGNLGAIRDGQSRT